MKCRLMCCIFVIISVLLQGCGNGGNADSMGNQVAVREYKKSAIDLNITPDYTPGAYLIDMTDSLCYFVVEIIQELEEEEEYFCDYAFYYQSLDTPGEPVFITKTEASWVLSLDAYTDASGQEILCVLTLEDENCTLTEYDNSGTQIKQFVIFDEEFVRSRPGNILKCQDGSYIAYNAHLMYLLEESGDVVSRVECPGSYFQRAFLAKDGEVYITYAGEKSAENYISKINLKNGALSETQSLPCSGDRVCELEKGKLLLMDEKVLYCYDMTTQKAKTIVETALYNIFWDRVLALNATGDSIRILSWKDRNEALPIELIILTPKTEEELAKELEGAKQNPTEAGKYDEAGKRIIILYDPNGLGEYMLEKMIDTFNEDNEEYTVVVYSGNPNIETVLAASESPDLMFPFSAASIETYQAAGYLLDMTPYLEKSSILKMNDLQESVVRAFSFDGGLYALPRYCTVETLLCPESCVEGGDGWTVDEFLGWLEENEMVKSSEGLSRDGVLTFCLKGNIDNYVDFEQREADFTSEAFKSMLSRIKTLELNAERSNYSPIMECDVSGEYLYNSYISGISLITEAEYVLGEKLVLKGLPNDSGEPKVLLNSFNNLCILKKSECPEGAFAFIEHCLTYDEGISDGSNDTYERMMIRQIISEEVQPYFLGQKDLDTICEIMQSRVNILLSERE